MTTQSGFILSHLEVYSVAKCIITVKFLIMKFAPFDSINITKWLVKKEYARLLSVCICVRIWYEISLLNAFSSGSIVIIRWNGVVERIYTKQLTRNGNSIAKNEGNERWHSVSIVSYDGFNEIGVPFVIGTVLYLVETIDWFMIILVWITTGNVHL